jgi:hypothetical protein
MRLGHQPFDVVDLARRQRIAFDLRAAARPHAIRRRAKRHYPSYRHHNFVGKKK